jgi:hypothetical protein
VRKETLKLREEVFICMFCDRAGHLDEFCFRRTRIERRRFDYARNSYHDEFSDFPPHSYSRALPRFSHGPSHRSYGCGSRENNFETRHFGYGPRPHRGDHFPRRPNFPAGGSQTHPEPKHLDGPCFPRRSTHPTGSNGKVLRAVKISSGHKVKC